MSRVGTTLVCALVAIAACEQREAPTAPAIVSWPAELEPAQVQAPAEVTLTSRAPAEADVVEWPREQAAQASAKRLEEIALYGDGSPGDGAARREVRVVLRFDGVAVHRRAELPAEGALPRRLVLDLDGVDVGPAVPAVTQVHGGGLERIRAFAFDRERVRVSFDLAPTAVYRLFFLSEPFRVVIDFRHEARRGARAGATKMVVLDPGHGGRQSGARGPNGLKESHVALALARRVRRALRRQAPGLRVVMTRDEDRAVSLEERTAIANALDADLFVSIHLNASEDPNDPGGIATFVLDTTDDQAALRLAALENEMGVEGVSKLQFLLASLYRRDQVQRSRALAEDVQRSALRAARKLLPDLNDRGVKSALFYVLVGAAMPAILVEGSFISSPREAEALASDEYRQALADGIAEGILRHLQRADAR